MWRRWKTSQCMCNKFSVLIHVKKKIKQNMKRGQLTALLIMGNICWFLCINHYKLHTYWLILYSDDVNKYIHLLFHLHVSLILTVSESSVYWKTFSPHKSLSPCRPKWKTWRKVKKQKTNKQKNSLVMRYHPKWEQVWDYFFKVKTSVLWKTNLMYKDY